MPQMNETALRGLLGLCQRAGKLQSGGDMALAAIRSGKARVAVVDAQASANTVKKITDACIYYHVPLLTLPDGLLGAACGSVVAILNFTILCLTVQSAVEIDSKKKMRQKFQMSYNVRLLLQAAWVIAAYLIPQVHFVAGALPVLFPNVVIFFLQSRGKLVPNDEKPTAGEAERNVQEQDEPEDHPGPFEV